MKNIKTTLLGVGVILATIGGALKALFDGDSTTNIDIPTIIAGVSAGVGLILAKDAKAADDAK
jgi:hypothetical protein